MNTVIATIGGSFASPGMVVRMTYPDVYEVLDRLIDESDRALEAGNLNRFYEIQKDALEYIDVFG